MARFASGKYSYGISDRSGFRYRLRDMRREWTGLLVGPDEYESKHPQLTPPRNVVDAEALRNPRPDTQNIISVTVKFPTFNLATVEYIPVPQIRALVGSVSVSGTVPTQDVTVTPTSVTAQFSLGGLSVQAVTTYTVTVASGTNSYGTGNKYYIAELSGASPTLTLNEGDTYKFDQSDSSNSGHPLRFSTTANGSHGGGSEYTTGVTTSGTPGSSGAYTQITVAAGAPTLYYYCTNHSGMGGTANTP